MNPAHWPMWWDLLVSGVAGFIAGVVTTARMAAHAAAARSVELAREMVKAKEKGDTLPGA